MTTRSHPYLRQQDFEDPMFLRIRRRVWLILLPHCTGQQRAEAKRLIAVYDEIIGDKAR